MISDNTIYSQVRESYKIILAIVAVSIIIQLSSKIPNTFFESSIIASTAIVFFPLGVAISSFIISKIYGGSKVFGKSYFFLGVSHMLYFIGEAIFYFHMDIHDEYEFKIISEILFISSTPLLLAHIIINIRYFVEKLEKYQKTLLIIVPIIIVIGYSLVVMANPLDSIDDYFFNLIFVTEVSIVLGFTIVAFTVFRHTVLFVPWFLLLIGILFGTAGSTLYRYTDTISVYDVADPTTGLWLASSLMIIYALYKHQKSI